MELKKITRILIFVLGLLRVPSTCTQLVLGIENASDSVWASLQTKNIGLVTNQTGVTQKGERTLDVLVQRGLNIKKIFAPEHGIDGTIAAEKSVGDSVDHKTKIPIISLYGHGSGKKIGGHMLRDIDTIIFDMQDCGMRHFTYISTLLHVMEAAAHHAMHIVVLDRPNPLGIIAEGPMTLGNHTSFIAAAPIPLRHGMTIGELAQFFNTHVMHTKASLHVVPMVGFDRTSVSSYDFPPFSPFVKNRTTCHGYSILGLLGEVRPFDTGLGTDNGLRVIALPADVLFSANQWRSLAHQLQRLGISTKTITYFSPRKKKHCHGLELAIADINKVHAFQALVTVLKTVHDAGVPLMFSQHFDVAVGSRKVHEYCKGLISKECLATEVNQGLQSFMTKARTSYLYSPLPTVNFVA